MDNLKKLYIYIFPFFTCCGALYHIAYWDTFNLNGLEIIDISTLIKSFVYPFLCFTLIFFSSQILYNSLVPDSKQLVSGEGRHTKFGRFLNRPITISILVLSWVYIVVYMYFTANSSTWYIWATITSIVPAVYLDRVGLFLAHFENRLNRVRFINAIVFIPIFSFAAGKYYSFLIFENERFDYIVNTSTLTSNADTLKIIGRTQQNLYLTNFNNSKIYEIERSKLDTIVTTQFKKQYNGG